MPASEVAVIGESFNETEHFSVERLAGSLEQAERGPALRGRPVPGT